MRWTEAEIGYLKENYREQTHAEIGAVLGRTERAVRNKCWRLGLVQDTSWTPEEIAEITSAYRQAGKKGPLGLMDLARRINRSKYAICIKARELGLPTTIGRTRDEEYKRRCGAWVRKAWAEGRHPRGMLGKTLSAEARTKISKSSKRMWADPNSYVNSDEHRKNQSDRMMKWNQENDTTRHSRARGGRRVDLGIYVRSSWEANYARYLNFLIDMGELGGWEYEPDTFVFEGIKRGTRSYTPDFKITNLDGSVEYHEVKGWLNPKSKTQFKRMAKYHPGVKIIVIDKETYRAIARECKNLIPNWE